MIKSDFLIPDYGEFTVVELALLGQDLGGIPAGFAGENWEKTGSKYFMGNVMMKGRTQTRDMDNPWCKKGQTFTD